MYHCSTVVKELLERADKPGSTPGDAVSVSLYLFFLFGLFSFTLFFLLVLFSLFLLLTLLVMHLDFYYGKGISKALNLHTGQAYDQKKTISCQDMSLL